VGFAAETGDPLAEARRKLETKGLDLIVANDVTLPDAGFAVDTNRVTFITAAAPPRALPLQNKLDIGRALVAWLEHAVRS
jgi:phosphopantothenoylcysteine decarboxylase/phosphopantothenate--cysteine ligase